MVKRKLGRVGHIKPLSIRSIILQAGHAVKETWTNAVEARIPKAFLRYKPQPP